MTPVCNCTTPKIEIFNDQQVCTKCGNWYIPESGSGKKMQVRNPDGTINMNPKSPIPRARPGSGKARPPKANRTYSTL